MIDIVEKWTIHGIMPGEYEIYGDWLIQTNGNLIDLFGGALVFHDHGSDIERTLYTITIEGKCRKCGEKAPPGVLFKAKTYALKGIKLVDRLNKTI